MLPAFAPLSLQLSALSSTVESIVYEMDDSSYIIGQHTEGAVIQSKAK